MSVGFAYDLRECNVCGMLYDHEAADWFETACGDCKTREVPPETDQ